MLEGPIGAAAFNNEFGRPNLAGYFRSFESGGGRRAARLSQADHDRRRRRAIIAARMRSRPGLPEGALLIQLGGPGMLIGMGGGAASSMGTGANTEDLDFDSVQRGNAEIQRRAQEVIDRCWQLGEDNPILSIHDVGAGGLVERAAGTRARRRPRRAPRPARRAERRAGHVAARNLVQRGAGALRAGDRAGIAGAVSRDLRARALSVRGARRGDRRRGSCVVEDPRFGNKPVDMDLGVLLGKPPRMLRDVRAAHARAAAAFRSTDIELEGGLLPRAAPSRRWPTRPFLISIGDRTVGGLCARDPFVGPWQVPVADCAVTLLGFGELSRARPIAMGERTPLALIDAPASGRMAVGEALTNLAAAPVPSLRASSSRPTGWRRRAIAGEDAALFDTVRAVALELCPALGHSHPGRQGFAVDEDRLGGGGRTKEVVAPLSLIVSAFAPCSDVRRVLTPQLRLDCGDTELLLDRSRRAAGTASAARSSRRCIAQVRRRGAGPRRCRRR